MRIISNIFSIYIVLVMLGIGLYMVFIQSANLIHVDKMHKEGTFAKVTGWFYIVISVVGFVVIAL